MANKANNTRSAHSKTSIKEALINLLENRDLAKITIRDICETAGVTRSTFYMHYDNLNALLKEIESALEEGMLPYFDRNNIERLGQDIHSPYLSSYRWFEYCLTNAASFRAILGPHGDPGFEHRIRQRLRNEVNDMMDFDRMPHDKQRRYVVEYTVSAIMALLHCVLEDEASLTPGQIAFIANIIREGPMMMKKP
jgi:AcrR family transcriptional regulator